MRHWLARNSAFRQSPLRVHCFYEPGPVWWPVSCTAHIYCAKRLQALWSPRIQPDRRPPAQAEPTSSIVRDWCHVMRCSRSMRHRLARGNCSRIWPAESLKKQGQNRGCEGRVRVTDHRPEMGTAAEAGSGAWVHVDSTIGSLISLWGLIWTWIICMLETSGNPGEVLEL